MKKTILLAALLAISSAAQAETYSCFWHDKTSGVTEEMGTIKITEDENGVESASLIDWGKALNLAGSFSNIPVKRVGMRTIIDVYPANADNSFNDNPIILTKKVFSNKVKYDFSFVDKTRVDFCKKSK